MAASFDTVARLDLVAGETRTFAINFDDYLFPAQSLASIVSAAIEEAGGATVAGSALNGKRGVKVQVAAGSLVGGYSATYALAIKVTISERNKPTITVTVRIPVKVVAELVADTQLMNPGEDKYLTIDFTNVFRTGEKISGITSLVMDRTGGGAIQNASYSISGKYLSFEVSNPTIRETYKITAVVRTWDGAWLDTVKATVILGVE